MEKSQIVKYYSPAEERLNVLTHAIGFLLSLIGTIFLVQLGIKQQDSIYLISFSVFGLSVMILYAASTLYHNAKKDEWRMKLKIFDHAAIYVLIAGTYTPFTLITLKDSIGMWIFITVWSVALFGIILKLFFTGRFKILSTLLYVAMGWIIIFAINPLIANLSDDGLFWLFSGGAFYTTGAVFYSIKRIPFNHAIFHFFVLFGSACHFTAVFSYCIM